MMMGSTPSLMGFIPILQEHGLFHQDYEGTTLRDYLNGRARQETVICVTALIRNINES